MTDTGADEPMPLNDEDRLPWLEAVDEDEAGGGPSAAKLIAFVVIGLAAIGLIVGGLFWMGNRDTAEGEARIIAAPQGDYKVKPDQPGGMKVEGEGDTAFAASEGADPNGRIDVNAVAEAPVARAPAPSKAAAPAEKPAPAPKQAEPATPAASGGATIQLGAFSSPAAANAAWKALSGRFTYLAPLNHGVTPVANDGKTLYRLRASGPDAANLCGRLRVAGESCVSIN